MFSLKPTLNSTMASCGWWSVKLTSSPQVGLNPFLGTAPDCQLRESAGWPSILGTSREYCVQA